MFNLILMVDAGGDEHERHEIGKMSMREIKEFEETVQEAETFEGYMYDGTQFCIKEKAFFIFFA